MGLLGSIGDTISDAAGSVTDAVGDVGGDVLDAGKEVASGDWGGAIKEGAEAIGIGGDSKSGVRLHGSGTGSGRRSGSSQPPQTKGGQDDGYGFQTGGSMDLPGLETSGGMSFNVTGGGDDGSGGAMQMGGGSFGQALMADMLSDAVEGSTSRALLEAMQAGTLQQGVIQQPVEVQTPRGVEYHSRPGFRTVTLSGQKVSVFKPVARALGLLPGGERTFREKADDAAREYLKMRRRWKDLASKFGFKSPQARKSGPSR